MVLLFARLNRGIYQPLDVPPYVHLIGLPGARERLGPRLNHLLCGFNVNIADLDAALDFGPI